MPPVRRALAAIVAAVVLAADVAAGADDGSLGLIEYRDDALTVHVSAVRLSAILGEFGRQSGAQIRGQVREDRAVTAEFRAVPSPQALARLLDDQDFVLVYGKNGRLKLVRLLAPGAGPPVVPVETAAAAPARAPFPGSLPELIARHAPVPIGSPLADVLGTQSATLGQLLDLSLHHEDSTIRAEATRTGLAALESDPGLRSAVIGELDNTDSAALGSLLRSSAGEQAQDLAMQVLRDAHVSQIRVKASAVLQRLRAGG